MRDNEIMTKHSDDGSKLLNYYLLNKCIVIINLNKVYQINNWCPICANDLQFWAWVLYNG